MAIKPRRIRGLRDSIPGGFVIGRIGKGKGAPTLLSFKDIIAGAASQGDAPGGGVTQIVLEAYCGGVMRASEVIGQHIAPVGFTLPAGLEGAHAIASVASTTTTVLSIRKATAVGVGTEIGTITFTSSNVGVFAFATATEFAIGDRLLVQAPSPSDLNLANLTIVFIGTL